MPPFNATLPKFNMAPSMAAIPAPAGAAIPNLADIIPAGQNLTNTFLEDATDVVNFTLAVLAIQLPDNYDCEEIVNTNGQLHSYFLTLRMGIIVYALTAAAHGRMKKTFMAKLGTLREMQYSNDPAVKAKWDDFTGPLFAYLFSAIIPADSDIKAGALMDISAISMYNNVMGSARCTAPVWSLAFLSAYRGATGKDKGLFKGHNYELALQVDRLVLGFKDKVVEPKSKLVYLTDLERPNYFVGNSQHRMYPHDDEAPVLADFPGIAALQAGINNDNDAGNDGDDPPTPPGKRKRKGKESKPAAGQGRRSSRHATGSL
jgi:hypothetical protein